ncbi:MAG: thioredoxin [Deltaproteobacteria bacterium]|nr:thioredoxin [Deltaproteobacteria bacterium]
MAQQQKVIAEFNEDNFTDSIIDGVTLVDFWAPWCSPCLMQTPILEDIAQAFLEEATVAQVNVEDYPVLAERFNVQGIPTLIIFKDGKVVKRFMGVQSRHILVDTIQKVL